MSVDLEHFPTSPAALRMMSRISPIYDKSYMGKWIFQVMGLELDDAHFHYDQLRLQAFPETTTWAMPYWELCYGITPTGVQTIEQRRRAILAKRDTKAPMNPKRMEHIITTMTGCLAHVTEDVEPYTFTVEIQLGAEYISFDFSAVISELVRIKPSHQRMIPILVTGAGIVINRRIDSWQYRVPECGTIRCGTWWMPSTLGWSEKPTLSIDADPGPVLVSPELTGTLPVVKTPGYSLVCGAVRAGGAATAFKVRPAEAGEPEKTGTLPETATAGHSITAAVRAGGNAAGFKVSPELAGTLPETAVKGCAITGNLSTGADAEGFKINPEFTGTLPQEAQHGERED